jgi:hypothetical protein
MPLWKLQTVGDERLDFLYENLDRGTRITLRPGVAYCLRAFYGLLRDLIQGAWARFVQRLNADKLGTVTDLGVAQAGGAAINSGKAGAGASRPAAKPPPWTRRD